MSNNKYNCKICGREFISTASIINHLRGKHQITKKNDAIKKYYDKYLKVSEEGICQVCKSLEKQTRFLSLNLGYNKVHKECGGRYSSIVGAETKKKLRKIECEKFLKENPPERNLCNCGKPKKFLEEKHYGKFTYQQTCGCKSCVNRCLFIKNIESIEKEKVIRLECQWCEKFFDKDENYINHVKKHIPPKSSKKIIEKIYIIYHNIDIPICPICCMNNCIFISWKEGFYIICKKCSNDNCLRLYENKRKVYGDDYMKKLLDKKSKSSSKSLKNFAMTERGKLFYKNLGKHNSKKMIVFNQTPQGKENIRKKAINQSCIMREKIKNGEFTPCITNSWTHRSAIININETIYKFRSTWEAVVYVYYRFIIISIIEYEKIRIQYIDKANKLRNYIVDFIIDDNKLLEVKPIERISDPNEILKIQAGFDYANKNNMSYILCTNDDVYTMYNSIQNSNIQENIKEQIKEQFGYYAKKRHNK